MKSRLHSFLLIGLAVSIGAAGCREPSSDSVGKASGGRVEELRSFGEEAGRLAREWESIPQFHAQFPEATLEEAGEAQAAYVETLLEKRTFAGVKGALVGEAGQKLFGIDGPLTAVLFREGWHEASRRPEIPVREGTNPGIETELGILLGEAITEPVESIVELKSKVKAIVPVIELPAGRHDWKEKPTATDLVATNVDSDHFIVGTATENLRVDLDSLRIRLEAGDGTLLNETSGGEAKGGQWANFLLQVNEACRRGYRLERGNLIISGALGKIVREGPGSYLATYSELGSIEFSLTFERE
ncbi:MAG: hypothetical protein AAGC68_08890 [Verrucomicrobiota bacterium]